jgi:DNA-binding NtrC family response regulator
MADRDTAVPNTAVPGIRVLLVEDEFLICDMMAEILTLHGFEVHATANADDALEHLTCGAPCDILLTDLNLGPGIDGVALSKMVRKLRPDLPVVYVSGSYNRLDEFQAVPGARFVAKPCNPERLCAMLSQISKH